MWATARGLGLAGNLQRRAGSGMGERYYNFVDITRKSMFATQGRDALEDWERQRKRGHIL